MTFYFPEPEDNRLLREFGGPMLPSTLGETMGASFGDPTLRPTELTGTEIDIVEAQGRASIGERLLESQKRQRRFQEDLRLPEDERFAPEAEDQIQAIDLNKITAAEANEKYRHLGLKFDAPVNPDVAEILATQKQQERIRQDIIARGPQGATATAARFAASFAGAAIDPLNIASAFIPVVGEARYAGLVARMGLTGGRAARGAIEGVAGAALVEPLVYGLAQEQQLDYQMSDALANVAFGGILGGGLHAVGGRVGDYLMRRDPAALEAALRASVAQAASGRLVDIEPVLREDFVTTESRFMQDLQTGTALTTRGVIDADIPLREMLRLADEREAVMIAALDRHGEALTFATRAEAERESRRRFGEFDVAEQEGQFVLRQPTQMEPLRGSQGEVREFPNERAAERFAKQTREEGLSVVPVVRPGERPAFALVRGGTPEQVAALKAKPELASMPQRRQLSLETGRMAPQQMAPEADRVLQRIAREQAEKAFAPERQRSADFPAAARADATVRTAPKVYDGDTLEAQLDGIRQEVEGLFKAGMVKEQNVKMIAQATQEALQHVESFAIRARAAAACLVRAA